MRTARRDSLVAACHGALNPGGWFLATVRAGRGLVGVGAAGRQAGALISTASAARAKRQAAAGVWPVGSGWLDEVLWRGLNSLTASSPTIPTRPTSLNLPTSLTRRRSLNEKRRRDAQGSTAAIEPARLLRRIEFGEAALTGIAPQHPQQSRTPRQHNLVIAQQIERPH